MDDTEMDTWRWSVSDRNVLRTQLAEALVALHRARVMANDLGNDLLNGWYSGEWDGDLIEEPTLEGARRTKALLEEWQRWRTETLTMEAKP
jgi:hypothetical protein